MDSSSSSSLPQNSLSLSDSLSDQSPSLPPLDGSAVDQKLANGVNGAGSASDNEGFVSGEDDDDDEEEPTRPILVYSPKGNEGADDNASPNSAAQFSAPEAERPIAKVTIHDDDDDVDDDDVHDDEYDGDNRSVAEQGLDGGVVLEKGGGGDEKEEAGVESVKELDTHDVVVEASVGDGDGDVVESGDLEGVGTVENGAEVPDLNEKIEEDEKIVSEDITKGGENEKVVEVVEEGGSGDDGQEDVVVEASGSDNKGFEEGIGGLENGVKKKEEDEEDEVVIEDLKAGASTDQSDSLVVESGLDDKSESVAVENNGGGGDGNGDGDDNVKFTGSGDSLVDTLQVNPLRDNVAVVGDKVEVEESEIKGLEAPAPGVSLDNGFGPIEQADSEDVVDEVADGDAESGQNVDTAVEEGDAGLVQKSDIAPPEEAETETSELAIQSPNAVQDAVKIEANGDEAEPESHVEASGEGEEEKVHHGDREIDVSALDGKGEETISGSSDGASKRYSEDSEQPTSFGEFSDDASKRYSEDSGQRTSFGEFSDDASKRYSEDSGQRTSIGEISQDDRIDGQIVTDSDEEEVETDDEGDDGKELFDSATLAALLKAASGAGQDGDSITITSQDGSRLFSVERPAGLGSSLQSGKPAMRQNRPNFFAPSINRATTNSDNNLSEEEKKKLGQLQQIRINYLRLVQRLGFTTEESIAAQVLYRLTLVAGRYTGQIFSLDAARETASQLEAEGRDDFNYSINILVLGKTGVGKSATINSIFGETKTSFSAYGPATTAVTEIVGTVDGVKIRVFDTPGLKSSALEQSFNRKVLSMVKKVTKKSPPDIVLYVDRLDLQTRDLNDLPMLRTITGALGSSIWRNVIVTLTHAASAPPDGPSGSPLSYDVFVAQRSHIVQQSIGQAVGDLRLMNPSLMNPVSLVENHPSCRKNRDGQKVLPNGTTWRPMLLLLCYSMKTLSEASNLSKAQESFDHRRLFGFRTRSPPLPYLLSWLLQSRAHPKLSADQGGAADADSDIEMADLSDSDLDEEEDEYDQLPPFKPLRKSQLDKLNREQKKAYFDEYDYRVKLLQKKQWREELRRMRELKKRGNKATPVNDYGYGDEDDQENGAPAAVPVPLPDMVLPPSFDSDNPAYRYRFLEPTSQLLTRPVLDTHSWDHDCGYDGVNIEHSLAIINKFPTAVTVQVTKDKKDFSIHLDSSVAAKLGENGSTMAGFDIQNIGKQLAYIVRGETKFKTHKRNKTAAGFSVTFLGENVSTGLKVEDQIALGKRLVLVGSAGTVRCQSDSAYGANVEVRLREADFPIGQDQSSLSLSLVKWRGDLALGANFQSQFSLGRSYKMAVRAGLNNKLSGQITVRTSSSDQLQIALVALLPIAKAIYKNFWPGASENYSIY